MTRAATHPTAEQLAAFGLGRLPPSEQAEVESHVASCSSCCAVLKGVSDDTLLAQLRQSNTSLDSPEFQIAEPSAARPSQAPPPELLDHPRYRIVRLLGVGGMGEVYQAEHRLMERPVALKVISPQLTRNPLVVERFRLEVRAAARLSHPNIVTAHDAEQAGDLHFLVMEYVEGISLARLVEKRGPLPVIQACHCVRQAALGLAHAHEQGMVHRDVKPQNLMLTRKGQVKILDFGLARLAEEAGPQTGKGHLTMLGTVLGTPDYIAPEQVKDSRTVDVRADIYSLGCTLYFLLTGRVPFPSGSAVEKALAHCDMQPRSLTELRDSIPPELTVIVEQMMAKDPSQRYQSAAEVAQALAPFLRAGSGAKVKPATVQLEGEAAKPQRRDETDRTDGTDKEQDEAEETVPARRRRSTARLSGAGRSPSRQPCW
jgi:serine/threonine protein kinase